MKPLYYAGKITRTTGKWSVMFPAVILAGLGYGTWKAVKKLGKGAVLTGTMAGATISEGVKEIVKTPYESAKNFINEKETE
jgi:hypothetical protein